jgi:hypothetical protein
MSLTQSDVEFLWRQPEELKQGLKYKRSEGWSAIGGAPAGPQIEEEEEDEGGEIWVTKGRNGGELLRRLKPTVGCNANKRRRI